MNSHRLQTKPTTSSTLLLRDGYETRNYLHSLSVRLSLHKVIFIQIMFPKQVIWSALNVRNRNFYIMSWFQTTKSYLHHLLLKSLLLSTKTFSKGVPSNKRLFLGVFLSLTFVQIVTTYPSFQVDDKARDGKVSFQNFFPFWSCRTVF